MILYDLANNVAAKIGLTDAATLTKLKGFAATRHRMLCDSALWRDLLGIWSTAVAAAQTEVILKHQIERVLACRYDTTPVLPVDQMFLFAADPGMWDRTGTALRFARLPSVGTLVAPVSEKLRFTNSSPSDYGTTVSIVGELAGAELRETLTLGTSTADTANSYSTVISISKRATVGTVAVTGVTSSAALLTLLAADTDRRHCRLRLLETPSAALTLYVLGKRRAPPLSADSDLTAVEALDRALEAFVLGDAYEWMSQGDDATAARQEAGALLELAKQTETHQEASLPQLVPYDAWDTRLEETFEIP